MVAAAAAARMIYGLLEGALALLWPSKNQSLGKQCFSVSRAHKQQQQQQVALRNLTSFPLAGTQSDTMNSNRADELLHYSRHANGSCADLAFIKVAAAAAAAAGQLGAQQQVQSIAAGRNKSRRIVGRGVVNLA